MVALAWAVALAVLSLFLVNPNADDSEYVHLSSWVAAHGGFPVGDTLFSDQALPAIFYPPLSSYEALVGAFARTTELPVQDVVYFSAPPVAAALSVLALWRLLRRWRVRAPATALTVAIAFLMLDAAGMRTFGSFWLARMWQGKVIFVAVLVPLLIALLVEYAERPTRRGALLLGAAGVAAVGLTTTAIFVVPVVAAGCLLPLLLTARRRAATGLAATLAYPLAAGAFTLAVGGRNPQVYTAAEVVPRVAGARRPRARGARVRRRRGRARGAGADPQRCGGADGGRAGAGGGAAVRAGGHARHVPGHGARRGAVAPLLGAAGRGAGRRARRRGAAERPGRRRALPAVAVGAALLAWGTPVWSAAAGTRVTASPQYKLSRHELTATRHVLAVTHPGDVILAPRPLSQALLKRSGAVVVIDPADRYVRALDADPAAHASDRLLLENFASHGLATLGHPGHGASTAPLLALALRRLHVDLACVRPGEQRARALLRSQGFTPVLGTKRISCLRAAAMITGPCRAARGSWCWPRSRCGGCGGEPTLSAGRADELHGAGRRRAGGGGARATGPARWRRWTGSRPTCATSRPAGRWREADADALRRGIGRARRRVRAEVGRAATPTASRRPTATPTPTADRHAGARRRPSRPSRQGQGRRARATARAKRERLMRPARAPRWPAAATRSSATSARAGWRPCGWRATRRSHRDVAIKLMADTLADDERWLARFQREARAAAALSHPHIVKVFDFGIEDHRPYLVMAHVAGGSLRDRLRDGGELPDAERLARELLGALAHVHAAGIVHRDVKPGNILLDEHGRSQLTDFGIARPQDATAMTQTGMVMGTIRYLAPEVAEGGPATERSDLYAAGGVLREVAGDDPPPRLRELLDALTDRRPGAAAVIRRGRAGAARRATRRRGGSRRCAARRRGRRRRSSGPKPAVQALDEVIRRPWFVPAAGIAADRAAGRDRDRAGGRRRRAAAAAGSAAASPAPASAPLDEQLRGLDRAIDAAASR